MTTLPKPTEQQSLIIKTVKEGNNLFVEAGAGAAKSTTIYMAIKKHVKESLYLVFNAANRKEANEMFQELGIDWAVAHTWHSLAYKYVVKGSPWAKKDRIQFFWDYNAIQGMLNNYDLDRDQVYEVVELIKGFCQSDYSLIEQYVEENLAEELAALVLDYQKWCLAVWNVLSDKYSGAKITPDIYLKVFLNSNPDLSHDYKVIYLDEGQDTNPVCLKSFYQQTKCQRIVVGDTYQAIYAWRGAENAFLTIPESFQKLQLTESFRFGQEVADVANVFLAAMGAEWELIGRGDKKVVENRAVIVRNNITMFEVLLDAANNNKKVYAIADLKELFSQMYTASAMMFSAKEKETNYGKFPNKQLLQYKNWAALVKDQSPDIKKIVNIVKLYSPVHETIQKIKGCLVENQAQADLIVVTGHKSKGLQFDEVTLLDDFLPVWKEEQSVEEVLEDFIKNQGMNLLYVAATRPKVKLIMSEDMRNFIHSLC